jgi:hypothetical protein
MMLPASLWTEGGVESARVGEVEDMVETCVGVGCSTGWEWKSLNTRGKNKAWRIRACDFVK